MSAGKGSQVLALVQNAQEQPQPTKKGRLLFVEDVQALLPQRAGKPVSRWWVNHSFAPEHVIKIGRANAWWEHDALAWINAQKRQRAS